MIPPKLTEELPMNRDELTATIAAALGDAEDVISADVIDDGEIGVQTADGRFFVTVTAHD
ncbi:MAG: hypothetical protein HOY79_33660 [Streptomyces sp.]|nr:hypothetical protein [Streptomyces sp.]NUS11360.1 hypothetical protein [Streptomyces sp.]NUS23499.1 hypothetical protein [Streptomyces sp.]